MEIALFLVLALLGAFLLPISYVETPQGSYSAGPYAVVSYAGVAFYLVLCAVLLFGNWRSLDRKKRFAIGAGTLLWQWKKIDGKKKFAIGAALIIELSVSLFRGCTTHGSSAAWA